MLSLIFDTETTGKLDYNLDLAARSQPDIVQFCAWLDLDGEIISKTNIFVHGEKDIDEGAFETHRISREMTSKVGVSRKALCLLASDMIRQADIIVGHNVEFDIKMLLVSMLREGGSGKFVRKAASFCTMKNSTELVKIPSPYKAGDYKWPSLAEAYEKLVDPRGFENAHDAEADVRACQEIYNVIRPKTDS